MNTFISKEDFRELEKGDKLFGHGTTFEIETADCGGPSKQPTHRVSFEINGKKDQNYIFHDGENIRYRSEDKTLDGSIVGELIDNGNCRIIYKLLTLD